MSAHEMLLGAFAFLSRWSTSQTLAFFGGVSHWEIIVILLVILLVFGRRVPEVMRALGRGVTQFKKGLRDVEDEVQKDLDAQPDKPNLPGPQANTQPPQKPEDSKGLEG